MRLIDADRLKNEMNDYHLQVTVCQGEGKLAEMTRLSQAIHDHAIKCICDAPTIEVETLPVVQKLRRQIEKLNAGIGNMAENIRAAYKQRDELRETLDNVTAERDVLLILLKHYAGCWECEFRDKGECVMPFFKDDCNEWAWRGKQEGPTP